MVEQEDKQPKGSRQRKARGIWKRAGVYWLDFTYKGQRYRRPAGTSFKKAEDSINIIKAKIARGEFDPAAFLRGDDDNPAAAKRNLTLDAMADIYQRDHGDHRQDPTWYARSLAPWRREFGKRRLAEITTHDIERIYNAERRRVSHSTANSYLMVLSGLFTKAVKWGYLTSHPIRGKITKTNPDNIVRRYFPAHEQAALVEKAGDAIFRAQLLVALNTGLRVPGELRAIRWPDVDLERGILHIVKSKTHRSRAIPLNKTATAVFRKVPRHVTDDLVFHQPNGAPITKTYFRKQFARACKRAEIEGASPYVLRKTFATTYMNAGGEIEALSRILGHTNVNTTRRYIAWTDRDLSPSVARLDELWSRCRPEEAYVTPTAQNNVTNVTYGLPAASAGAG